MKLHRTTLAAIIAPMLASAALTPSGGDDYPAIAAAIEAASAGEAVELAAGTFHISASIEITKAVNLRADIIDGLALFFAPHWMDASVEELAPDGAWRKFSAQRTSPRIRRLEGLFAPGLSRVFKFVTQP